MRISESCEALSDLRVTSHIYKDARLLSQLHLPKLVNTETLLAHNQQINGNRSKVSGAIKHFQ